MPIASMPERFYPDATVTQELETPDHEDGERPLVRLSRISGQVMAATTTGLVAQITSPNLLDYDLLSDFFLTYRAFMTPSTLLTILITRLAWTVNRVDDFGRIVRVRVFVALRHWILNYFKDDFVPDLPLRRQCCDMINQLAGALAMRSDGGAGDLKVVGELKKCWRRTCAAYLDIAEHGSDDALAEIFPGGSTSLTESPSVDANPPPLDQPEERSRDALSNRPSRDAVMSTQILNDHAIDTIRTNEAVAALSRPSGHLSHRDSDRSEQAMSCSIPLGSYRKSRPRTAQSTTPIGKPALQRVPSDSLPPSVARSRSRSRTYHNEVPEESIPDLPTLNTHMRPNATGQLLAMPQASPGSLIRGGLLPWGSQVESFAPPSPSRERSSFSSDSWSDLGSQSSDSKSNPTASSPGMKRLIGSMKRVLSSKHDSHGQTGHGSYKPRQSPYTSGHALSRKSTQSHLLASRNRSAMLGSLRSMPRIDVLAQKCYDDHEIMIEKRRIRRRSQKASTISRAASLGERSAQAPWADSLAPSSFDIDRMQSAVTGGSRSMVTIGGTGKSTEVRSVTNAPGGAASLGSEESLAFSLHAATEKHESPNEEAVPDIVSSTLDDMPLLKRQPGGNLRGVEHVRSLQGRHDTFSSQASEGTDQGGPLSQPAPYESRAPQPKALSLLSAHSSQPKLRSSFEREVAKLARLANNDDGDGGIEATLRKLEGDITNEAGQSPIARSVPAPALLALQREAENSKSKLVAEANAAQSSHEEDIMAHSPIESEAGDETTVYVSNSNDRPTTFFEEDSRLDLRQSVAGSEQTDRSVPLLERGTSYPMTRRRRSSSDWLKVSLPPARQAKRQVMPSEELEVIDGPYTGGYPPVRTNGPQRSLLPGSSSTQKSFFIDKDHTPQAEESRESRKPQQEHKATNESFFFDDSFSVLSDNVDLTLSHPLRHSATPPLAQNNLRFEQLPPSVRDFLPAHELKARSQVTPVPPIQQQTSQLQPSPPQQFVPPLPELKHLPFILGVPSQVLAQQFTLVEKDALAEIDWHDLIELRWSQSSAAKDTWPQYLQPNEDANLEALYGKSASPDISSPGGDSKQLNGIDLVIARFNIVVKWAASEIVLCDTQAERTACVIKYIHVASACRRLHNWATMYQITTALLCGDIARLKATWADVPEKEMEALKHLETLIMPMRNFANLRQEIENGTANVDAGCIPFIGLYTHDLIYNAQKPHFAHTAASNAGIECGDESAEKLINFERYRATAGIVKNMLRMLDASSRYNFEPQPEVLSRCLWMACLSDWEIGRRSRVLEP